MSEARIHAPELPDDLAWYNTETPIRIADQRGKVVLLDFWTYCCINCMHVLPDLRYLEDKYGDSLTVIGLHSPKFPNERVGTQLQKAINRHHIRHPVAHDPGFTVWKQYGIRAWPSIIFIDPEGYVVGVLSGEGRRAQLDALIQEHLDAADAKGIRSYAPLELSFQPERQGTLRFPGKLLTTDSRLYISNSGRNQVLETTHDGHVLRCFGSGAAGFLDGRLDDAMFSNPQGLARQGERLYVADTDNHAIRVINLINGEVTTLAGTGLQGRYVGNRFEDPLQAPLNSPWDLCIRQDVLYIAMAGQHQIWSLDLGSQVLEVFVGTGREDITDGTGSVANFAQPSGIVVHDDNLYIADAETSAVRSIRIPFKAVSTLIGTGLFDFGDSVGIARSARLQHPLDIDVEADVNRLWIADTYNHKIKTLDLGTNLVAHVDVGHTLNEPGGIHLTAKYLWIANTNAHEIVQWDRETQQARVIEIDGSALSV